MALYEGFQATNVWKAFTLNSLAASLVILIAMLINNHTDMYKNKKGGDVSRTTSFKSVSLTLIGTFAASFLAFTTLHFVFGYGGGQLAK